MSFKPNKTKKQIKIKNYKPRKTIKLNYNKSPKLKKNKRMTYRINSTPNKTNKRI